MSNTLTQQGADRLHQFSTALAETYGIPVNALARQFSISGPVETGLRAAVLESVEFLSLITCMDVDQIKGQVVQTGIGQLYTGRKQDGRFKKKVGVKGNTYELSETDSCAVLDWATLCVWANAGSEGEFIELVSQFINTSFALDMIRVGWNGVKVSDDTDPDKHPLGEDVNIGWHQLAREWEGGKQIIKAEKGDKIYFDPEGKGDYKTLDEMASDLINTTIDPLFRQDPRLVVLVGTDLVAAAQAKLYSEADKPTEQIAAQHLAESLAGRKAMIPPFFPANRMVVTTLDNLHIYTQRNTRKRKADDNQDAKGFENQYWRMEGYAIGEYLAYGGFEEADVVIGARPVEPEPEA
ncbi:phage major capsid protein, P2 family [Aeromonas hydrophila]|uniref:phage major capsid protein, P2 family n=1 Tax=Aeromonas hydrophila TaxID=644 RepID=UPI003D260397